MGCWHLWKVFAPRAAGEDKEAAKFLEVFVFLKRAFPEDTDRIFHVPSLMESAWASRALSPDFSGMGGGSVGAIANRLLTALACSSTLWKQSSILQKYGYFPLSYCSIWVDSVNPENEVLLRIMVLLYRLRG